MVSLLAFLGFAVASPPDVDAIHITGASAPNDAAAILHVEDYKHLKDIDGAQRDAQLMAATLAGSVGLSETSIKQSSVGNRSRMRSTVISAAKKVRRGGTLWVYFSGYGLVRNGEWLLLGKDTARDGSTAERDGIKLSEIYEWSSSEKIERVMVVVDAAFSGHHRDGTSAISPRPPGPPRFTPPADERIVVWMADKTARNAPHYRAADHGMFTYLVAGALRGWADGAIDQRPDGILNLAELQRFVRLHTHALGSSHAANESSSEIQRAWEVVAGELERGPGRAAWAALAKVEQNLQVIQAIGRYRMQAQGAYEMAISSDDPEIRRDSLETFVRHFGRPEVVVRSSMWIPQVEEALRELDGVPVGIPEEEAPLSSDSTPEEADQMASATVISPPEAPPEPAPVVEMPPPPGMPSTCKNLLALEPFALMGQLTSALQECLEGRLSQEEQQTVKNKISRVLMMDAEARRDGERMEVLLGRHLEEIDRSDPDLCFKYAVKLARKDIGHAEEAIRWAGYALENKQEWTKATYKRRLFDLYKLRAETSNRLWTHWDAVYVEDRAAESQGNSESWRNQTKQFAREWLDYAKASEQRVLRARNLCIAAAGTSDFCEADSEE